MLYCVADNIKTKKKKKTKKRTSDLAGQKVHKS